MVNFKYNFFSLSKPHRTLTTANSCYEVQRACTVALMLSGQYSTDHHRRWWSPQNPQGHCRLCTAPPGQPPPLGTLSHQLLHCPSLQPARDSSVQLCRELLLYRPQLQPLFSHYLCGSVQLQPSDSRSPVPGRPGAVSRLSLRVKSMVSLQPQTKNENFKTS